MDLFHSLILGLLQGGTEFIPVSSSAHLVLVPWLLNWSAPGLLFDTTVHWGTLVAVVAYFRKDLVTLVKAWAGSVKRRRLNNAEAKLAWLILLGTVPAAVVGVMAGDFFERLFDSPDIVAGLLLVTGMLLIISDRLGRKVRGLDALTPLDALIVGAAQAVAIAPGISRSGSTIAAGLFLGVKREAAARYSFLLSIPIILGAGLSQLLKAGEAGSLAGQWGSLVLGFVAAVVAGYVSIKFLLSYLRRNRLYVFAAYCGVLGALSLAVAYFR